MKSERRVIRPSWMPFEKEPRPNDEHGTRVRSGSERIREKLITITPLSERNRLGKNEQKCPTP